ncbi:MAG: hypothetical protein ABJH05_10685 [Fulvivirga sp.]
MNKSILLPLLTMAVMLWSFTTPSKYEEAMKKQINNVYQANTLDEFQVVINALDRIAQNEDDKWEPLYYAGFGYVMMATRTEDATDKDKLLDQALEKVKAGLNLQPKEDELIVLEGFIHMIRVTVDPATRGQQYSGLSMQALNKALAMDANNPRAMYMLGQMELGTARFFGSDTTAPCEKLQKAVVLFENQKPEGELSPVWGQESAIRAAQACN